MKRYAQIVKNKAYWIFEAEELPPYPNPEDFIEITGREDIEEGYLYDAKTGEFTAPVIVGPTQTEPRIDEVQAKILVNTETLLAMKELEV